MSASIRWELPVHQLEAASTSTAGQPLTPVPQSTCSVLENRVSPRPPSRTNPPKPSRELSACHELFSRRSWIRRARLVGPPHLVPDHQRNRRQRHSCSRYSSLQPVAHSTKWWNQHSALVLPAPAKIPSGWKALTRPDGDEAALDQETPAATMRRR